MAGRVGLWYVLGGRDEPGLQASLGWQRSGLAARPRDERIELRNSFNTCGLEDGPSAAGACDHDAVSLRKCTAGPRPGESPSSCGLFAPVSRLLGVPI